MRSDIEVHKYLKPGYYVNSDHPSVISFAREHARGFSDMDAAKSLFIAVRDGFRYDPYDIVFKPELFRASTRIDIDHGFCVHKATVLTAVLRSSGIPARLMFADVRNHLNSKKLSEAMGTDVFYYHGITEVYLDGRWLKTTPAFDKKLCHKLFLNPLEFDGRRDCVFHPYDRLGNRYMEYIRFHGSYFDLPYELIRDENIRRYPKAFCSNSTIIEGDFLNEATCGR